MKFGLYSSIASPPRGEHLDRCVDQVIAEAQLAEASGFDACFFGEHHQDKDGFLPSPLIVATAVAAQTRRLHVGTSVILLPLHHPVHVAEDVTTLDIVSKGRVILGVGVGYQAADFQAFGVPMEHRAGLFEEGVEIIRKCWSGEPFSFHGTHYTLDNLQMRPRPLQTPAPSLWIGASVPAAVRRAGRLGDAFVATPSTTLAQTVRLVDIYRQAAVQAGRQPQVVLMRDAWVATSRAEAEAMYGPAVPLYLSFFYPRERLGLRVGLFLSGSALANAYGGALAYGISQARGVIHAWRILFLVEGQIPPISILALSNIPQVYQPSPSQE